MATSPEDAARQRLVAIESLQEQLRTNVSLLERQLLEGLLTELQQVYDDPPRLVALLEQFTQQVHLPVLTFFGQSLLTLPTLTLNYFSALTGETDYAALRAPLTQYVQRVFGLGADGQPLAGGYLSTYAADATVQRELLAYSYRALTSGTGLTQYRTGLTELITGAPDTGGLFTRLYRRSYDTFNEADRVLQTTAADSLGFSAYLYLGGLIASSRPFCKARNGKVFLKSEIEAWKKLDFDGKPDPYEPLIQLGGYNCRHGLNAIDNGTALAMRPDVQEDAQGRLFIPS